VLDNGNMCVSTTLFVAVVYKHKQETYNYLIDTIQLCSCKGQTVVDVHTVWYLHCV